MTAAPALLAAREASFLRTIADELHVTGDMIETLATSLAVDPTLAARHSLPLQSLDLIAQTTRACAALVGAILDGATSDDALNAIGLADLEQRLRCRHLES